MSSFFATPGLFLVFSMVWVLLSLSYHRQKDCTGVGSLFEKNLPAPSFRAFSLFAVISLLAGLAWLNLTGTDLDLGAWTYSTQKQMLGAALLVSFGNSLWHELDQRGEAIGGAKARVFCQSLSLLLVTILITGLATT